MPQAGNRGKVCWWVRTRILSEIEFPLFGGNANAEIARVGDTVRRAQTPASATIHHLLQHLENRQFSGCPRFLGTDVKDREILSWVDGDTGLIPHIWADDGPMVAAAQLLRAYHDATEDFQPDEGAVWACAYPDATRHEVICHNDFAPYNFVYSNGIPHAVLDFDLAGPGPRIRDVAYAAYWMVPLAFHASDMKAFAETDMQNGSRRLMKFCKTYGIAADGALLEMVSEVLAQMGDEEMIQNTIGPKAAARLKREGHLDHWQREAEAFMCHMLRPKSVLGHLETDFSAKSVKPQ